eukprot:13326611-Ditylum_brightwellii.AAC.1
MPFIITTDGLADNESMSYEWKICTMNEEVIATNAGPAPGNLLSFLSKSYGVLSAICCVKHAAKYTNTLLTFEFNIFLDNESVIKRVQKQAQYTYDYSFNTLAPDWDVIAQICQEMKTINFKITFKHIK